MRAIIALIILFVTAGFASAQKSYTFGDGLTAGKSQNKIIVVHIYADNDKWSEKMQSEVYGNTGIQEMLNNDFIYVRLNGADGGSYTYKDKSYSAADLAKQFGVTSYPTHVFLTPSGEIIGFKYNNVESKNFPGFADQEDFQNILIYFKEGKYSNTDLSTVL